MILTVTSRKSGSRRVERVWAIELSDEDARSLLRLLPNMVPGWVGFLRQGGLVTDGDPEEFRGAPRADADLPDGSRVKVRRSWTPGTIPFIAL